MRDTFMPTFGVSINEGSEYNLHGPEYTKKNTIVNKMSKKDYKEKY